MREGFVHGRFQIFHLDHLEYALAAAGACDFLRVGVTQPDIDRLLDSHQGADHRHRRAANPLSYGERATMITRTLTAAGLDPARFAVQPFPIERPELLPGCIPVAVTAFTTICDEWNEHKIELLRGLGYPVQVLFRRGDGRITGSAIRRMIAARDPGWTALVPPASRDYLLGLGIEDRL